MLVSSSSTYEWRRTLIRRSEHDGSTGTTGKIEVKDSKTNRNNKIINKWKIHPGYGPSQIRNMLKRDGFKVSVGTVRHVMEENGYIPPTLKRKEHVGAC